MSVVIGDYLFSGPFVKPEDVEETQGIYVVLAEDIADEENEPSSELEVVEVGFASNLRAELIDHENQDQWSVVYEGRLYAAVMYADENPLVSVKSVFASIQPGMTAHADTLLDPEEDDDDDEDDFEEDEKVVAQLSILNTHLEKLAV
ncbi:MAG: hypothetical protein C0507_16245 [Cyanobacteria bacterium PR.3.49]|nr:hypothetical protein [Cyanobacteria bacterium PR.3.49]